jgi:ferredoxin
MKTIVYYFSGTGNSLHVARELARGLGDADLVAIPTALKTPGAVPADRIGIVFPVYAWGLPLIVAEFCRRLEAKPSAYVFAVATCGGNAAGTLRQLRAALVARGLSLSAGYVLRMPGNYTPLYGAPSPKSQARLFAEVAQRLPAILETIRSGRPGPVDEGTWLGNLLLTRGIYRLGMPHLREADRKFQADSRCDGCGICRQVCPVDNIVLRDGRPAWQHRCEQCMACLQWCPKEAIQAGSLTVRRARYRHPGAKARDFMLGSTH